MKLSAITGWFCERHRLRERPKMVVSTGPVVYTAFAFATVGLGIVLIFAPSNWFGPSWSYFHEIPHNGFGMGVCLIILGALQMFTVWLRLRIKILAILLFLSGFTYWTAGILIAAEGLFGHMGLMEAPFMLYVGAHEFAHSAALMVQDRRKSQCIQTIL